MARGLLAAVAAGAVAGAAGSPTRAMATRGGGGLAAPPAVLNAAAVTTSGVSAGAFMASQMHVAFSSLFSGAGLLAGGPYYCAQGMLAYAEVDCMTNGEFISVSSLTDTMYVYDALGSIDGLGNLTASRVWLFSATGDTVVATSVVQAAQQLYAQFLPAGAIQAVYTQPGEHSQQTLAYGSACSYLGSPYINNCNYDAAGAILSWLYNGTVTAPSAALRAAFAAAPGSLPVGGTPVPVPGGAVYDFDQTVFVPNYSSASGLGTTGYVYIPDACLSNATAAAAATGCALHVAFHGCNMPVSDIGSQYIMDGGYLPWAAANNIVVLFPQAASNLENPEACFDWWAYTNSAYATKTGVQPAAVRAMIGALGGI